MKKLKAKMSVTLLLFLSLFTLGCLDFIGYNDVIIYESHPVELLYNLSYGYTGISWFISKWNPDNTSPIHQQNTIQTLWAPGDNDTMYLQLVRRGAIDNKMALFSED